MRAGNIGRQPTRCRLVWRRHHHCARRFTTFDLANAAFTPKPNGIGILADGSWLLAHLGNSHGGVFRLQMGGRLTGFVTAVDGEELPATNYVHIDGCGWV